MPPRPTPNPSRREKEKTREQKPGPGHGPPPTDPRSVEEKTREHEREPVRGHHEPTLEVSKRKSMKPTVKLGETRTPAESSTPLSDLEAQLHEIAEQERAVALQKQKVLVSYYEVQTAQMRKVVRTLVEAGYKPAQIVKALGLGAWSKGAVGTTPSPSARSGPTTHAAWVQVFLGRTVQTYLKAHPEVASSLKAQGIKPAQLRDHIPSAEFAALKVQARQKADAKGPAPDPVPVTREGEVQHDQSPSRNTTQKLG